MATNHTEKYELNQWLPTDPVIRTDFNEDNAKIEAALHELWIDIPDPALIMTITERLANFAQRIEALENHVGI